MAASAPAAEVAREPAAKPEADTDEIVEVHKCLVRAREHAKRAEHAAAVQAFERALAIAPQQTGRQGKGFRVRAEAVRDYGFYLLRQQGAEAAYVRLRQEIAEAPRDSESAHMAVSLLTSPEFARRQTVTGGAATAPAGPRPQRKTDGPVLDPHDEIFWAYLEKTSDGGYTEERLIAGLLDALPQSERETRWSQLEDLGRAGSPSRAGTCGRLLLREGAPERAIPHLERAIGAYDRRGYDRQAISDLCRAYLAVGNWRRAEALLPVFRAQREPDSWCLDAILRAAAREGALDESLRLWRRRANLDLRDLELLPELVRLGMREHLRAFYAELATACPESWIPARALAMLGEASIPLRVAAFISFRS